MFGELLRTRAVDGSRSMKEVLMTIRKLFRKNTGTTERIVRVVIGVGILGIGLAAGGWWGLFGLIPLVTGVSGRCPLRELTLEETKN